MKSKILQYITIISFILLSSWWLILNMTNNGTVEGKEMFSNNYGLFALWGGILGLYISSKWGGFRSVIGKSICMFSLGLLFQELGQLSYNYYLFILNVEEIPYPSIGDAFFLASTPLYAYGAWLLLKATGATFSLTTYYNKIIAAIIPIVILIVSKLIFLPDYEIDWNDPIVVFFDIAYPIGQALYISIALLAYIFSRKYLGGYLKTPILIIIISLFLHYIADYMFTYQYYQETWEAGESNDYVFLLAYFVMTMGLIQFSSVTDKLNHSNTNTLNQNG